MAGVKRATLRADALRRLVAVNDALRSTGFTLRRRGADFTTEERTWEERLAGKRDKKREINADEWRELSERFAAASRDLQILSDRCFANANIRTRA